MDKRDEAMNKAIKEAYFRQHQSLRGGKQYSTDEQYRLVFQRGVEFGQSDVRRQIADRLQKIVDTHSKF